jgi:hypothetical protein
MRQVLAGLAAGLIASSAAPLAAQQGSIQVSAAAQAVTGDPDRIAGQNRIEPDFGVSWLQPRSHGGIFQMEMRGTRRDNLLHAGRMFFSIRDLKHRGITWSFEAGDTHFAPPIGDYKFSNLFTPAVTFNGAALTARTPKTTLTIVGGRASAWRNIFGSDPETLGQTIGSARATHKISDRLELSARASRVRTWDLKEFSFGIASSDQAGGGARVWLGPSVQAAADASVVWYERTGTSGRERDASAMAGVSWLHRRGWLQVNGSRFSPGDFPTLNSPLPDREGLFAAGDYDIAPRLRLFAGWDAFRSNLDPAASLLSSRPLPESSGAREFGGVRVQLGARSTLTVRVEQGDRRSQPLRNGLGSDSDTGSRTAEWQAAAGKVTWFTRYSIRDNVDRMNGSASYAQQDLSSQVFASLTPGTQVFATALATRTEVADSGGSTYWQMGVGGQVPVLSSDLWLRGEGTFSRNVDLLTQSFVPRGSLNIGLNGQLSRYVNLALNVNVDRTPMLGGGNPWMTRSTLRLTHMLPTGSAYVTSTAATSEAAPARGTGTVTGSVFADWNGNGIREADEPALEGIPVRVGTANVAPTGRDGQFSFFNVPVGRREVGLDTGSLPLDFDAPEISSVTLDLVRGGTSRVSFGLHPLGTIHGPVTRDVNGNGKADPGEEPMNGAILILDGGARSEQVRGGVFRFDSVRSGSHTLKLLLESLPEGSVITGDAEVAAALTADRMSVEVPFLVNVQKRPEIRKVFPPRGGGAAPGGAPSASRTTSGSGRTSEAERRPAASATPARPRLSGRFAIQIAALSEEASAASLAQSLEADGLSAYIVPPDPASATRTADRLFRVRVGPYQTRAAASKAAKALEKKRGEKSWIVQEK